ncbi:MAG: type II toxin-antitoxin system VapC family toxin [Planctomycetes bacterium]|nr:type II toxin-antitoxin system VapC family toxin [Planctomycetota bacterium]
MRDDPGQVQQALRLLARLEASDDTAYVPVLVLCELVWVLQAGYGHQRTAIVDALRRLLTVRQLTFAEPDVVARALDAFGTGNGDFADYVLREQARGAGCTAVATFDKVLLKDEAFQLP